VHKGLALVLELLVVVVAVVLVVLVVMVVPTRKSCGVVGSVVALVLEVWPLCVAVVAGT
jgi:hypothetical protein